MRFSTWAHCKCIDGPGALCINNSNWRRAARAVKRLVGTAHLRACPFAVDAAHAGARVCTHSGCACCVIDASDCNQDHRWKRSHICHERRARQETISFRGQACLRSGRWGAPVVSPLHDRRPAARCASSASACIERNHRVVESRVMPGPCGCMVAVRRRHSWIPACLAMPLASRPLHPDTTASRC